MRAKHGVCSGQTRWWVPEPSLEFCVASTKHFSWKVSETWTVAFCVEIRFQGQHVMTEEMT